MSAKKTIRRGSAGKTALGLLVLGCSSAIFGALVVGPNLGKKLDTDTPITVNGRKPAGTRMAQAPESAARPQPAASREPERRADAEESAPPVSVRGAGREEPSRRNEEAPEPERPERRERRHVAEPPEEPVPAALERDTHPRRETPHREPAEETRPVRRESEPAASHAERREAEPPRRSERETHEAEPRRTEPRRSAPERETPARPVVAAVPKERREPRVEHGSAAPRRTVETPKLPEKRETRVASARVAPARVAPAVSAAEPASPGAGGKVFRVRLGWFREKGAAEEVCEHLNETSGVSASVVRVGGSFRVQVGAYRSRTNAERVADDLRTRSYVPEITEAGMAAAPEEGKR